MFLSLRRPPSTLIRWSALRVRMIAVVALATMSAVILAGPGAAAAGTFRNPLSPSPDPFMTYTNGQYYAVEVSGTSVTMRHAPRIAALAASTPQVVYTENDDAWNHDMWAPSYFNLNDHWYIYVAADGGDIFSHRMRVLESDGLVSQGADPAGGYHYKSTLQDPATSSLAIDGSPFTHNGQLYFVWAGGYCCGFDTLRVAPMSNPYTISGAGHELGTPTCEGVAEAPATIHRNGRTFLTYSMCDTAGPDYHLALWSIDDGADPLDNASWHEHGAVFSRNDGAQVYSVGSNGFFTSPDGTQDWIVYQAKDTAVHDPSTDSARNTRAQRFTWNGDGTPNFGTPIGLGTDQAVPSGDPDSPSGSVSLSVGTALSLRVTTACCTDRYLRHQDGVAVTSPISSASPELDKADATFVVRAGLGASSCYSFESRNYPGQYLRHRDYRLRKDANDGSALFAADATFCAEPGKNGQGVSLRSFNLPDRYIRHINSQVYISADGGPNSWDGNPGSWNDDVSWAVSSPWS